MLTLPFPHLKSKMSAWSHHIFFSSDYLLTWAYISGKSFGTVKPGFVVVTQITLIPLFQMNELLLIELASSTCGPVSQPASLSMFCNWDRCLLVLVPGSAGPSFLLSYLAWHHQDQRKNCYKGPNAPRASDTWISHDTKERGRNGLLCVKSLLFLTLFLPFSKVIWNSIKCSGAGWT